MAPIHPYKIEIPDDELEALKQKLKATRLPGSIKDEKWEYGAPL